MEYIQNSAEANYCLDHKSYFPIYSTLVGENTIKDLFVYITGPVLTVAKDTNMNKAY